MTARRYVPETHQYTRSEPPSHFVQNIHRVATYAWELDLHPGAIILVAKIVQILRALFENI